MTHRSRLVLWALSALLVVLVVPGPRNSADDELRYEVMCKSIFGNALVSIKGSILARLAGANDESIRAMLRGALDHTLGRCSEAGGHTPSEVVISLDLYGGTGGRHCCWITGRFERNAGEWALDSYRNDLPPSAMGTDDMRVHTRSDSRTGARLSLKKHDQANDRDGSHGCEDWATDAVVLIEVPKAMDLGNETTTRGLLTDAQHYFFAQCHKAPLNGFRILMYESDISWSTWETQWIVSARYHADRRPAGLTNRAAEARKSRAALNAPWMPPALYVLVVLAGAIIVVYFVRATRTTGDSTTRDSGLGFGLEGTSSGPRRVEQEEHTKQSLRGEVASSRDSVAEPKREAGRDVRSSAKEDERELRRSAERRRQEAAKRGAEVSRKHRDGILLHAQSGRPLSGLEQAIAAPILAPVDVVIRAATLGNASVFQGRREALRQWSERIREAWGMLTEHKAEMLSGDRSETFEQLKAVQAECNEAWADFKQERASAGEDRDRRKEEWRERQRQKRERLQALLDKNVGVIDRLRDQIGDLQEKIATAWNADWASEAEGWVEEKEQKIRDIDQTNQELEEKIRDIDDELDGR